MEIFNTIKCPNCEKNLSMFKAREEFHCSKCNALLHCENYMKVYTATFVIFSLILFVLGLFLKFTTYSIIIYTVITLVTIRIFSKKIKCTVVRENPKTEKGTVLIKERNGNTGEK